MSYIKQLQNNHPSQNNSIALIDCNNFYASCERIFNPRLIGKPIVVLSNNDGCIITRSAEAKKLGIPTFAIVDTNSDPNLVDFCIPGNDDASRSIEKIVSLVTDAIQEGLSERNSEKEAAAYAKAEAKAAPAEEKVEEPAEKK